MKDYDVFISFAEEDKPFVESLAKGLQDKGLKVWYSGAILKVGDSISEKVNEGLSRSRYGVVIFSHNYLLPKKKWPQAELNALFAKATFSGNKVILPVWKDIGYDEVLEKMPLYAELFSLSASIGIDRLVEKISGVVRAGEGEEDIPPEADTYLSFIHKGVRFVFVPSLERGGGTSEADGFFLCDAPVSASQWELIMNNEKVWDDKAKNNVSPNDCQDFISKISIGLEKFQCRLPAAGQLRDAYRARETLGIEFAEDDGYYEISTDDSTSRNGKYPLWRPEENEGQLIKIAMPQRIRGNIFRIALFEKKARKQNNELNRAILKKWKDLIAENNIERVLGEIYRHPSRKLLILQNEIILHHAHLAELNKRERMGTVAFSEYSLVKKKIMHAVLQMISEIEKDFPIL